MDEEKLQETTEAAFLGLSYAVAALTMHVFNMSKTAPATDDDIRRLVRRLAPMASDLTIEAAFTAVRHALDEVVKLERKVAPSH